MAAGAGVTAAAEEESTSFVLDPEGHFYVQDQFAVYANGVRRSDNKVFGVDLSTLKVEAAIGRGACGVVRRAVHVPTGTLVALKEIPISDKGRRKQIMQELSALYDADCVSLIGFHGAFYTEAKRLHRDLKPSNILLNSAGWVRLTDFGVSTELASSLGAAATVTGTVAYMAPERLQRQPYSFQSDMWSLGLTLLQCAFGELPFKAVSPEPLTYVSLTEAIVHGAVPALPAGYSSDMEKFLLLMLHKEPDKRADARVMLAALGLPWFAQHGIKDLESAVKVVSDFRTEVAALLLQMTQQAQAQAQGQDGAGAASGADASAAAPDNADVTLG